jgi:hypothetical protein
MTPVKDKVSKVWNLHYSGHTFNFFTEDYRRFEYRTADKSLNSHDGRDS